MKPLSDEARALIAEATRADVSDAHHRVRVLEGVRQALAAVPAPSLGKPAPAGGSSATSWITVKIVTTVIAATLSLGGGLLIFNRAKIPPGSASRIEAVVTGSEEGSRSAPTSEEAKATDGTPSSAIPAGPGSPASEPLGAQAIERHSARPHRKQKLKPASSLPIAAAPAGLDAIAQSSPFAASGASPTPVPAAPPSSSLAEELSLLHQAQTALKASQPRRALTLLEAHATRFPDGALREERRAARIVALCELGRMAEAKEEAKRFLEESPQSPLAGRIRASCAGVDVSAP
jgi:hypothetical protein